MGIQCGLASSVLAVHSQASAFGMPRPVSRWNILNMAIPPTPPTPTGVALPL